MAMRWLLALAVMSCGGSEQQPGDDDDTPDATTIDASVVADLDGDGLDDAYELRLAQEYMPHISLDPDDGCKRSGLVVRVRPHPADPTKILIIYDHLFETDCGLGGHTGDNEAFGVAIDPTIPAPGGILAMRTGSHQNTACERVTDCSICGGSDDRDACDLIAGRPAIYPSKDKHGQYANLGKCGGACFDSCVANPERHVPPIANVGEPGKPLVSNLTTQGFINSTFGWTEPELMNVDPWAPGDFGSAGNIADDMIDPEFEVGLCPN